MQSCSSSKSSASHSCTALLKQYRAVGKDPKGKLKLVNEELLDQVCDKLQRINGKLPQLKYVKGKFIRLAYLMGRIVNSAIRFSKEELNTVLFALTYHCASKRAKDKSICDQMTAIRDNVTKYLEPQTGDEGHFKHTLLNSCAVADETDFNNNVALIVHRPPAATPTPVDPAHPWATVNHLLQELVKATANTPSASIDGLDTNSTVKVVTALNQYLWRWPEFVAAFEVNTNQQAEPVVYADLSTENNDDLFDTEINSMFNVTDNTPVAMQWNDCMNDEPSSNGQVVYQQPVSHDR